MGNAQWRADNADKMKEYRRRWYDNNKEKAKQKVRERRAEIKEWFRDLKSQLSCLKCGESHIGCLDFHHKDGDKEIEVGIMVHEGWSKDRILDEIAKCEVWRQLSSQTSLGRKRTRL